MSTLHPDPVTRVADKAGVIGAIVAAMGCAACFPALASLAAALGLGFLSQYEGVFIRYWLPLFAGIALLANVAGGLRHRQWHRMLLGVIGHVAHVMPGTWRDTVLMAAHVGAAKARPRMRTVASFFMSISPASQ